MIFMSFIGPSGHRLNSFNQAVATSPLKNIVYHLKAKTCHTKTPSRCQNSPLTCDNTIRTRGGATINLVFLLPLSFTKAEVHSEVIECTKANKVIKKEGGKSS